MNAQRHQTVAQQLAEYAHGLTLAEVPQRVVEAARLCLTDALGCALFGSRFTWSHILRDHALASGARGRCFLPGLDLGSLHAEQAALIAGAFSHAFELDSLRKPGAGVHPGATVALPALIAAQETGGSGADVLRAVIAGCEVMFRIGNASLHSAESRGFHAPGVTGVFGSTIAVGLLHGLSPGQLAAAMGIAGSMAGGLLAFAKAGGGGMVKRLHLGRAAQSGVIAVDLAERGYEGPATVLEGRFGVLEAFCPRADAALLVAGLGSEYELDRLCLKRYACHVTAQAPIQFLRQAMADKGFAAHDISEIVLGVSEKVRSHHADVRPRDVAGAQYSVPFALATAAHHDPDDPLSFARDNLADAAVVDLAQRIRLQPGASEDKWGAEICLRLHDGRTISGEQRSFKGCPEDPFSVADIRRKFMLLAAGAQIGNAKAILDAMEALPVMPNLEALEAGGSGLRRGSLSEVGPKRS